MGGSCAVQEGGVRVWTRAKLEGRPSSLTATASVLMPPPRPPPPPTLRRRSYWDFVRFREEFGAAHYNKACATVHAAGLMCFHHFPEFFTVIDAMYG